eukprot:7483312-Alexandrium_andersonii.AAC.1
MAGQLARLATSACRVSLPSRIVESAWACSKAADIWLQRLESPWQPDSTRPDPMRQDPAITEAPEAVRLWSWGVVRRARGQLNNAPQPQHNLRKAL